MSLCLQLITPYFLHCDGTLFNDLTYSCICCCGGTLTYSHTYLLFVVGTLLLGILGKLNSRLLVQRSSNLHSERYIYRNQIINSKYLILNENFLFRDYCSLKFIPLPCLKSKLENIVDMYKYIIGCLIGLFYGAKGSSL